MKFITCCAAAILFFGAGAGIVHAQAELTPWGNLRGIRIDGQLMEINTSICLIGPTMADILQTEKEKQHPTYERRGTRQIVTTDLGKFLFTETVQDTGDGKAALTVHALAAPDSTLTGAFLCFDLPADVYAGAKIELIDRAASPMDTVFLLPARPGRRPGSTHTRSFLMPLTVSGFRAVSASRTLEVRTQRPTEILILRADPQQGRMNDRIYLGILTGHTTIGQTAERTFMLKVSGEIDTRPAHISIDPTRPGRQFDGIGGNFRIQNETLDPGIIDYCLDNLNVRWARVEFPWRAWHSIESAPPIEAARAGRLDRGVRSALELTRKLSRRGIPIIVSAWSAPAWSIVGETNTDNTNGVWGNPLDSRKMRSIIRSIGDYFAYLKESYGVEPALFSFNESDLGINVRMTGEEHAEFIRKLGAHLASKELPTKMLLGDNSDATTIDFIEPALQDPATHRFIGAISFHAWRGCDNWTLSTWADASRELNVPLMIGESGTDAKAYLYPDVFLEPSFAMDEVDINVRACNTAHVRAILQWQLTSDYSLLKGGGIYGTGGPLQPTQRFWNLKQLSMAAPGSFILPAASDTKGISCTAFGAIAEGTYSVHIVNHGAARRVTVTGFPEGVKELRIYVTDARRGMEEGKRVRVADGEAEFTLAGFGFTSVVTSKQ